MDDCTLCALIRSYWEGHIPLMKNVESGHYVWPNEDEQTACNKAAVE